MIILLLLVAIGMERVCALSNLGVKVSFASPLRRHTRPQSSAYLFDVAVVLITSSSFGGIE